MFKPFYPAELYSSSSPGESFVRRGVMIFAVSSRKNIPMLHQILCTQSLVGSPTLLAGPEILCTGFWHYYSIIVSPEMIHMNLVSIRIT